jgi:hypothetical protein
MAKLCATFNFWYGGENGDGESSKDGHSGFNEEDEVWVSEEEGSGSTAQIGRYFINLIG